MFAGEGTFQAPITMLCLSLSIKIEINFCIYNQHFHSYTYLLDTEAGLHLIKTSSQ